MKIKLKSVFKNFFFKKKKNFFPSFFKSNKQTKKLEKKEKEVF